jgi:hypothetical protein
VIPLNLASVIAPMRDLVFEDKKGLAGGAALQGAPNSTCRPTGTPTAPTPQKETQKKNQASSHREEPINNDDVAQRWLQTLKAEGPDDVHCTLRSVPPSTQEIQVLREAESLGQDISAAVAEFLAGANADNDEADADSDEENNGLNIEEMNSDHSGISISSELSTATSLATSVGADDGPSGCGFCDRGRAVGMSTGRTNWEALALTPGLWKAMWKELVAKCQGAENGIQLGTIELARKLATLGSKEAEDWQEMFQPCIDTGPARLMLRMDVDLLLPKDDCESDGPRHPRRIRLRDRGACVCGPVDPRVESPQQPFCQCQTSLWLSDARVHGRPLYKGVSLGSSLEVHTDELCYDGKGAWTYTRMGRLRAQIASNAVSVCPFFGEVEWTAIGSRPEGCDQRTLTITMTELDPQL